MASDGFGAALAVWPTKDRQVTACSIGNIKSEIVQKYLCKKFADLFNSKNLIFYVLVKHEKNYAV